MNKKIAIQIIFFITVISSTQMYAWGTSTWARTYGGSEYNSAPFIQHTSDGGYIMTGSKGSGSESDFWLLKLDSDGAIEWQRTYSGTASENPHCIQQTSDGGFILGGTTVSFGAGLSDFWVLKLNSVGDIEWEKAYGGSSFEFFGSVDQTPDGGYIVSGTTVSFGAGDGDVWILKLDSQGGIQWQKTYGTVDEEVVDSIHQTSDSGYIISVQNGSFNNGTSDIWLLKLDSTGGIQWQKSYGGISADSPGQVLETNDGGYLSSGTTDSFGAGSFDLWLLKTDSNGNIDSSCNWNGDPAVTPVDSNVVAQDVVSGSMDTVVVTTVTTATVSATAAIVAKQCGNESPTAQDDNAITTEDIPVTVNVLSNDNDPDNDPLSVIDVSQPNNGTTNNNGDGTITYTPNANFSGSDSFTYTVSDGDATDAAVVNVTVIAGNDPPNAVDDMATTPENTPVTINVVANDSDPDGGPFGVISVTQGSNGTATNNGDGTVTYVPNIDFNGSDTFNYTISDGQLTDTATVTVIVTPVDTCLFCDDFEDGVFAQDWTYEKNPASWTETGGNLIGSSKQKTTAIASPVFSGCLNCSVTATLQTAGGASNRVWLLHHYVDKENYVELLMKEESDRWVMKLHQSKAIVAKGKIQRSIDPGVFYQVMIRYDGTKYEAYLNGELIIALDPEGAATGGTIGFKVKHTTGTFGYVEVQP